MAAKTSDKFFGPGLMRFLKELEANNKREWFEANKDRYENEVREPARALIRAMEPRLRRISKHFVADDRKMGGSLMRIFRDVRFSKDKSPYKTNLGLQFCHEQAKDVHAPGFYLHADTKGVWLGIGMWHPDGESLGKVRTAIDRDRPGWKRATGSKKFTEAYRREGDTLKRAPKGYDPEHPLIEDLRLKDHVAVSDLKKSDLTAPGLDALLAERFAAGKGYVAWLCKAVEIPF